MAPSIKFIPSQIDILGCTTTEACRKSPIRLFFQDLGVLITMLPYLPWVFLPLRTTDKSHRPVKGFRDALLQAWLFILEILLLFLFIPAYLVLPGVLFFVVAALCILSIFLAAWPMHGPRILNSEMDDKTMALAKNHANERWVFVNGIMTRYGSF